MSSKLTKYACILLGALIGPWAQAQDAGAYPNRPIKLIVTVPPGGAADFIARLMASKLSNSLGQPVIVENKAGASGVCLLYTSPSPRDRTRSRMPSSA